jgi:hypothetical protein
LTTSAFYVCPYDERAPGPGTTRHLHASHASQSSQWNWPNLKQHTDAAAECKFYEFPGCLKSTTIITVTANSQQYESSNAVALVSLSLSTTAVDCSSTGTVSITEPSPNIIFNNSYNPSLSIMGCSAK